MNTVEGDLELMRDRDGKEYFAKVWNRKDRDTAYRMELWPKEGGDHIFVPRLDKESVSFDDLTTLIMQAGFEALGKVL